MPKLYIYFLISCFLLKGLLCNAQNKTPFKHVKAITAIPFNLLNNGIIIIPLNIDGKKDTLNFVFDTGSGSISIDSTTALELGLKIKPSNRLIKGIGGLRKINIVDSVPIVLNQIALPNTELFIADYTNISEYYGMRIDGIIGYNFINKYVIKIDYNRNKIFAYPKGNYSYNRGQTFDLSITGIPDMFAKVSDNKSDEGRYILDTGGDMQLMLSENFINDSGIISPKRKMVNTFAEGFGGRSFMKLTVTKKLQLGKFKFLDVPTYIFIDSANVIDYPNRKGIIGNDILRRFNVIINYQYSQINLVPNQYYLEPFDYGFSGLDLYLINGNIYVGAISKGTPAEVAGFKENDRVIGMGNVFTNNLNDYKNILNKSTEALNVVIERADKTMVLKLVVKSFKN